MDWDGWLQLQPGALFFFRMGNGKEGRLEGGVCWEMTERLWHFPSIAKEPLGLQTSPRFPPPGTKKHRPASM